MNVSRRRYMGIKGGILPYDAELEYLINFSGAYIDTGVECTSDLKVRFIALWYNEDNTAICGGLNTNTPYFRHHCTPSQTGVYWCQYGGNNPSVTVSSSLSLYDFHDITIDAQQGAALVDNMSVNFTPLQSGLTTGKGYGLFARIGSNGALQQKPSAFKRMQMWRNGTLLRDFIPVRVGKVGYMYDKVSQQLFGNAGTDSFILGPDIGNTVPYQRIEYLEGTGTQYIDTEIQTSQEIEIQSHFISGAGVSAFIYGVRSGTSTIACASWNGNIIYPSYVRWGDSAYAEAIKEYNVTAQQRKTNVICNGTARNYSASQTVVSTVGLTIAIFGAKTGVGSVNLGKAKFYFFRIFENGDMKRNLVPVRIGTTGYMYDTVSGELFGNAGTGDFTLGPDVI